MTFQQHVASIGNLAQQHGLTIVAQPNDTDKVSGILGDRKISIFINYATNVIMWADQRSGETKTFRF
jgi:hypothetical protein